MNPLKTLKHWLRFVRDYRTFAQLRSQSPQPRLALRWADRFPCLDDDTASTPFDHHYIYHTAWAARKVRELAPREHVDLSSSLYFNALVSAFVPIRFYDYRPAQLRLEGLTSQHADLTRLPFGDGSVASLSCMHVVEHVGLGRYGDPVSPDGDLQAMNELQRVLASGGSLFFVVPVGRPRIAFNAHRIYAPEQIVQALRLLELREFSLIPDSPDAGLIPHAALELGAQQNYGCGCFHFVRPAR